MESKMQILFMLEHPKGKDKKDEQRSIIHARKKEKLLHAKLNITLLQLLDQSSFCKIGHLSVLED